MTATLATRAPAKINLSLHVRGRRADGYHELESLVCFAGGGDELTLAPGDALSLSVMGPTAAAAGPSDDNLVLRAARELASRKSGLRMGAFHLVKKLPVATGVGGGSSDAAAALRLLAQANDLPLDNPDLIEAARRTGSDVPVCVEGRARMMRGAGETLGPTIELPSAFTVLVNPGVPVETRRVFGELGLKPGDALRNDPHPEPIGLSSFDALIDLLAATCNDLQPPARRVAPVIEDVISALSATNGCRLARMSGSGATCFGLYTDCDAAARAAEMIRASAPGWWVKSAALR